METGKKGPEKKFRAGAVAASVWRNSTLKDGKQDSYCTVSLERGYKNKEGTWQNTSSLRANDLPRAALVLAEAYKYLVMSGGADAQEVMI
ncbi:hypothetical protein HY490_04175 [Candidatus Woesearchaeota archaeon]|nr:hypothetical protein [Candidatus Woesearchaeota archaeon]